MNTKIIALPSGKIIFLDHVAYIDSPGILDPSQFKPVNPGAKEEKGKLYLYFGAVAITNSAVANSAAEWPRVELEGDDISVFLQALNTQAVDTTATLAAIKRPISLPR